MPDLDDLDFQQPAADVAAPEQKSTPSVIPLLIIVAVVIGAVIGYILLPKRGAGGLPARNATEQTVTPAPAATAKRPAEPAEDIVVPPLDQTDALVRELLMRLSAHPRIAAWLATDGLIRNFTVAVANVAEGRSPAQHLPRIAPQGTFAATADGAAWRIDVRSYRRYDSHADAVGSIDARGAARLYATVKPRIEEAYAELGRPHGTFDRALQRAIAHLLDTPIVEGGIPLERVPAGYAYADPSLESLSSAQKQLLRMGPRNMKIVQGKLREIREYLGWD